ncbi:transposon Tf2-9 polyprotein [Trichonephila clavipes]|nr:transposon Tf2-9 polyprotein [Trichonephila clavipes]
MQNRIVGLFQVNVISVGKLDTLSRHASHLKRVRTVPFALKGRVENEIDRLEREGIIENVDSSEWATPVVPVVKTDGSIRLCADYSVTLNSNLIVPLHPLPRLEEIFSSLNGGKQFTKLDFKHAYLQMKVHPDNGDRFNSCQVIYSQFGLAIHQNDHQARRRFVEWAQNEIAVVPDFHKRILFSDEAHFWLNGYVNKQNCRIWSEANPQVYVETPLHPLTVWCALWAGGILLQKR